MSRRRLLRATLIASVLSGLLGFVACEETTEPAPNTARFEVSGTVRLVGNLYSEFSDPDGSRTDDAASGVLVTIRSTSGVVDSTTTLGGAYTFVSVPQGDHLVAIRLGPSTSVDSSVRVADRDVTVPRLVVEPSGPMVNPPNPFTQAHGVGSEFTLLASQRVRVSVQSLGMQEIWSYTTDLPAGFHHVHWGSIDAIGTPVPPGTYILRATFDELEHYNVVFMTP